MTGTRQKPQVIVTMPHDRHFPGRLGRRIEARPGEKNTMIEPWVDVRADIDAINAGEAIVDQTKATAWVNGRLYGFHTGTGSTGKLYPMWGAGLISMDQKQIRALEKVIQYNGLNERSERFLAMSKHLTDADRETVRRVWMIREQERSGR